jgi:hypothetical protein
MKSFTPPLERKCHLREGGVLLQARVVHQDVEPAERRQGCVEQRLHIVFLGDVGLDGNRPAPHRLDLVDHPLRAAEAGGVVHGDVGAGRRERQRNTCADARTGAGDDGLLAFQCLVSHVVSPASRGDGGRCSR